MFIDLTAGALAVATAVTSLTGFGTVVVPRVSELAAVDVDAAIAAAAGFGAGSSE